MSRIVNKYNVVPFYTSRDDAQRHCPLFAPVLGLPWQFNNGTAITAYSIDLVNVSTGDAIAITTGTPFSREDCRDDDGSTYITYFSGGLASTPDEGIYQYRLTVDNVEYWSNAICIENVFNPVGWTVSDSCATAGGLVLSVQFVGTTYGTTSVEVDLGTGYSYAGSTSGAIDNDDITGSGPQTVYWKLTENQGATDFYRVYKMDFDTEAIDPCTTVDFTLVEQGGSNVDAGGYLAIANTIDLNPLGLLYSGEYQQRFYFKRHDTFPVPINEYTFIENGQGQQLFESLAIAEQLNFDIYPVPDHMLTVLSSIRAHDTVTIVSTVDGKVITPENLTISPRQTAGSRCSTVRVSYEANRGYVPGCNEDITLTSC